ncbi:MAG TPA: hypothetical protein VGO21_00115 [Candidatus Paceibacterota bacterium]|jgi:hypothetical protein|nr:hypothetical protein [Candidatus Paceibacterota bacterium]
MYKKSKITNLLVIPLIASAVFLANPALAAYTDRASNGDTEIRHKTSVPDTKKGVVGEVTGVNGTIIVVTTKSSIQYTVDAANATIMKASSLPDGNPSLVEISDIKVGEVIMVRGVISDTEI